MSFRQVFENYGASYENTMPRFVNSEQMYLRILEMLFKDESYNTLAAALGRGDLRSAFEAAHTLKGVSGNLGLTPLYNAVSAIVEPLRAGERRSDYPELLAGVSSELSRVEKLNRELRSAGQ